MKVLTDANFEKEVNDGKMFLVDFWAEWCAPCRMLTPILEEVSKEYIGKVDFGKLDISQNKNIASKFKVSAIPTMVLFKNGKQVNSIIGAVSKEKIKGMLDEHLK